jgi:hypothetical protein
VRLRLYLHLCSRLYTFQKQSHFPKYVATAITTSTALPPFSREHRFRRSLNHGLVKIYPTTAYVTPQEQAQKYPQNKQSNTQSWNARLVNARSQRIFSRTIRNVYSVQDSRNFIRASIS